MTDTTFQRATEFRNRNLAYLRTVDRHRLRGTLDLYVRELIGRLPAVLGTQRAAEHLILTATTLLLLTVTARDGVLVAGIPTIAQAAGTSESTAKRASKWLRNVCRAMNRPKRGRKGDGVNQYALPLAVVSEIANRVRAASKDASRRGLERKRMRDNASPGQQVTSTHVAPPSPIGWVCRSDGAGVGRAAGVGSGRRRVRARRTTREVWVMSDQIVNVQAVTGYRRQIRAGALAGDDRELQARLVQTLNELQAMNEKGRGLLIDGNLPGLVRLGGAVADLGTLLMMTAAGTTEHVVGQDVLFDPGPAPPAHTSNDDRRLGAG